MDHYKKAYQELQTRLENLQAEDQKEIQSSLEELQKNIDKAESEKKIWTTGKKMQLQVTYI